MRRDLPTVDVTTEPFWDAAHEGRLLVSRCGACGVLFAYPRPFCPKCWSTDVGWVEVSGRGTVYTFSVVHQNDLPPFSEQVPYVAAIVDLIEGPRMMTRIAGCAPARVSIGMAVEVVFEPLNEDVSVPYFRPMVQGG